MRLVLKCCLALMAGAGLCNCQKAGDASSSAFDTVKPVAGQTFTMVALRSGALFAYNPAFHKNVLTSRYSKPVQAVVQSLFDKLPPSCVFAGFSATVDGRLMRARENKVLRLDVDRVRGIRPLQQAERIQIGDASPTIGREIIC